MMEEEKVRHEARFGQSDLCITMGDITLQDTEAIVNAANPSLMGGGGVDGAIHRCGGPVILEECRKIRARKGKLVPGNAVMTTGGDLKASWVIHTAGPVWRGGNSDEERVLRSCYRSSLDLALAKGIKSISFPSISTGVYGYPVGPAARAALEEVRDFLHSPGGIKTVCFVLFDRVTFDAYHAVLKTLI